MHWAVVAPFFDAKAWKSGGSRWLDDFVVSPNHTFEKFYLRTDEPSWHNRAWKRSTLSAWFLYLSVVLRAFFNSRCHGIITVFPPMALLSAGLNSIPGLRKKKIVAWCFNIGRFPPKFFDVLVGYFFRRIDHIVVHSIAERDLLIQRYLVNSRKVSFSFLQTNLPLGKEPLIKPDNTYILSMGSANRDYSTLASAMQGSSIHCIVVANRSNLEGVSLPSNVQVLSNLSHDDCLDLLRNCLFSVVPLYESGTASGQITVVESLSMARPVVATRTIGTVDYIEDGTTGLLVAPDNPLELRRAIDRLVGDEALRKTMSEQAKLFAQRQLGDETAAGELRKVLDLFLEK